MNDFNENEFKPDLSYEAIMPWGDVLKRMKYRYPENEYIGNKDCPKCQKSSKDLLWIKFSSPHDTWKGLCGTAGPLSLCPKCGIQVEYIVSIIN